MTTRLEIVNAMLSVNGEAPASSVESTNPAVIQAANALDRLNKKVQARGWWFNKETITLSPDTDGVVVLPQNTLAVDPVDTNSPYVQRGDSLYDKINNTRDIGETVKCRLKLLLPVEDMPETAAAYLMDKACKEYYTDDDGDEQKIRNLEKREAESYAYFFREHLANEDNNIRRSRLGYRLATGHTSNGIYINKGA